MNFTKTAAMSLVMCGLIGSSEAQSQNVLGIGNTTCAEIVANASDQTWRGMVIAWMGGYISGVNVMLIVNESLFFDVSGMSADILHGTVVSLCTQHPQSPLIRSAEKFVLGLPKKHWEGP